jgi:hypothetical protein
MIIEYDESECAACFQVPTKWLEDELLSEEDEVEDVEDELEDVEDELPVVVFPPVLSDFLHPAKAKKNIKASPKLAWNESGLFISYFPNSLINKAAPTVNIKRSALLLCTL